MMFATAALPLSVEQIIGESATSLASRLAWRNGAPRLITFCSDLGIDHRCLTNGAKSEIHRVAALAGLDPDPLLFWTPRLIETDWFQLGQERIKFTALSRTQTYACPLCLRERTQNDPLSIGHPPGLGSLAASEAAPGIAVPWFRCRPRPAIRMCLTSSGSWSGTRS